jgi:hypothetical protein
VESITLSTHNAPWHFHSTTDYGKRRAPSIDEIPLLFAAWSKAGLPSLARMATSSVRQKCVLNFTELARIDHQLQPLDIVLINTCAGSLYRKEGYVDAGCGMGREATLFDAGFTPIFEQVGCAQQRFGRPCRSEFLSARGQDRRQIMLGMGPQQLVSNPSQSRQQARCERISAHAAKWSMLI